MTSSSKAWIFLTLQSVAIIALGHFLAGREGLLWALAFSLGINSFVYFYGDRRLLNFFPGKLVEGQDPWGALEKLEKLSSQLRVPTPKLIVLPNSSPQAFSLGHNWRHGAILVTEGLLNNFSGQELEAVFAYQLVSIKRLDTLVFSIGSVFCGFFLTVTGLLDSTLRLITGFKPDDIPQKLSMSQFFTQLTAPLVGLTLKVTSRSGDYFSMDEDASRLLGNHEKLAKVLWKLDSYRFTHPFQAPPSTAHMFIVNPLTGKGWTRYLQAQPAVRARIERLVGHYPI